MKHLPQIFVFVQFSSLLAIFLTGPLLAGKTTLIIFEISGFVLGAWAILAHGGYNFRIAPVHKEGARLITKGPYALVRHPMYLAIILLVTPLIIDHFTWLRLGIGIVLLADLLLKLEYEERQLVRAFEGYEAYRKGTWKLVPGVY
ncbi:MAG: hypothetical protein K9G67_09205 [Bacteroidales bacterium]|nr:hypothetical protein [Bacteroidales bacterium]MCF8352638.1 hypothetical protein [Bacteroidales bacterium]MCF8376518.1 hypothetical protein [Bacteroidales bacterium]MCF8400630.1 hypothetical protein [Bacteroidales bacterium]